MTPTFEQRVEFCFQGLTFAKYVMQFREWTDSNPMIKQELDKLMPHFFRFHTMVVVEFNKLELEFGVEMLTAKVEEVAAKFTEKIKKSEAEQEGTNPFDSLSAKEFSYKNE